MSIIPLDVQRRCERRWAARFSRPAESVALGNQRPEQESQRRLFNQGISATGSQAAGEARIVVAMLRTP